MLLFGKPWVCLAVAAAILAISRAPATAQGRRVECMGYAREAAEQFRQSVRLGCGFEGARWSDQREAHFAWCLVAPQGVVEESRSRRRMLFDCAAHRGGNGGSRGHINDNAEARYASCDTYAKLAGVQAEAAQKYGCGLRGPEWGRDQSVHFHWCMRSAPQSVKDQLRDRTEELHRCFGRLGN